jgi:hypothetical protein
MVILPLLAAGVVYCIRMMPRALFKPELEPLLVLHLCFYSVKNIIITVFKTSSNLVAASISKYKNASILKRNPCAIPFSFLASCLHHPVRVGIPRWR